MKSYRWSVTLDGRKVEVIAPDKFGATKEAARAMKVLWSKTARDMDVVRLGSARGQKR
jgi:hypothetical protein